MLFIPCCFGALITIYLFVGQFSTSTKQADIETRIQVYISTAVYELTRGSANTRKAIEALEAAHGPNAHTDGSVLERKITASRDFINGARRFISVALSHQTPIRTAALPGAYNTSVELLRWKQKLSASQSLTAPDVTKQWKTYADSVRQLRDALNLDPQRNEALTLIPTLLAEGILAYHEKDYIAAREKFAEVIRKNPNCGPFPRVGLGLCLLKLGHFAVAKKAFQRAIALDKENPNPTALSALAFIDANQHALETRMGKVEDRPPEEVAAALKLAENVAKFAVGRCANAQAYLELAHITMNTWTEHVSGSDSLMGALTRGSDKLVLLNVHKDKLPTLYPGEHMKVRVPTKDITRLISIQAAYKNPLRIAKASQLGLQSEFISGTTPETAADADKEYVYIQLIHPWALFNGTNLPLCRIDFSLAEKQASLARRSTSNPVLKAEALFIQGKAQHAMAAFLDASISYRTCLVHNPKSVAALVCLAQCQLHAKQNADAEELVSRALGLSSDDRSALSLHAYLSLRKGNLSVALKAAKRAMELSPHDPYLALLVSSLLQRSFAPPKEVQSVTQTAYSVLRSLGAFVPVAVPNNLAIAHTQIALQSGEKESSQHWKEAHTAIQRAIHIATMLHAPGASSSHLASPEVKDAALLSRLGGTVAFNYGKLLEYQNDMTTAVSVYNRLLAAVSEYFPAALSLALIERQNGNWEEAERRLKEITSLPAPPATDTSLGANATRDAITNAYILLAQQAVIKGDIPGAIARYRDALTVTPTDAYASVAVANLELHTLYTASPLLAGKASEAAREKVLRKAFDIFKGVLRKNPQSVSAGRGLACVLAEQRRFDIASKIFAIVRELDDACYSTYLNLGHVALSMNKYQEAEQYYKRCLKLGKNALPVATIGTVYTALSKCYALNGLYEDAIAVATKAYILQPNEIPRMFNLMLTHLLYIRKVEDEWKADFPSWKDGKNLPSVQHITSLHSKLWLARKRLSQAHTLNNSLRQTLDQLRSQIKIAEANVQASRGGARDEAGQKLLAQAQQALDATRIQYSKVAGGIPAEVVNTLAISAEGASDAAVQSLRTRVNEASWLLKQATAHEEKMREERKKKEEERRLKMTQTEQEALERQRQLEARAMELAEEIRRKREVWEQEKAKGGKKATGKGAKKTDDKLFESGDEHDHLQDREELPDHADSEQALADIFGSDPSPKRKKATGRTPVAKRRKKKLRGRRRVFDSDSESSSSSSSSSSDSDSDSDKSSVRSAASVSEPDTGASRSSSPVKRSPSPTRNYESNLMDDLFEKEDSDISVPHSPVGSRSASLSTSPVTSPKRTLKRPRRDSSSGDESPATSPLGSPTRAASSDDAKKRRFGGTVGDGSDSE